MKVGNTSCICRSVWTPPRSRLYPRPRLITRAEDRVEESTETLAESARSTLPPSSTLKEGEKAAKKIADTFAPRPSGKVSNPATKGTLLYDIFGYQALGGIAVGALLSFNVIFPSDEPSIAKLLGMWSIWMFSVPSWRARECTSQEKEALNLLFLLLPLLNVTLPFIWRSFPFVFTSDLIALLVVYSWKIGWTKE